MTGAKATWGQNIGIGAGNGLLSDAALENGLRLKPRTCVRGLLACWFVMTTDMMALVRSGEQQLHFSAKFVPNLLAAFQVPCRICSRNTAKTKAAF